MEYDLIVRNGYVVDGTGLPRRRVDVGVKDGKIARLARLEGASAKEEIDAQGRIVAPGIVDAHTHYDPQITFDPYATMSCYHGVTTVLAGNCGFSAAPVRQADQEFMKGVFARVEDMDPIALGGVRWDRFETFPEFMAYLKGNLGINFACYVGHSNLLRGVRGEAVSERSATAEALAELVTDEVPDALVNQEMQQRLEDLGMRLQAQGIGIEQYLAQTGQDQEAFVAELRETAAQGVRVDLALRAVALAEELDVSDEELEDEYASVAERVGQKPAQVRKQLERNGQVPAVRSDLRTRKALEWLTEHVELVDEGGKTIDRASLAVEPEPSEDDGSEDEAPEATTEDE